MLKAILASRVGLRSTQEKQDTVLVKRFAFIVGTDFLCWAPIITIKVLAFTGKVLSIFVHVKFFFICKKNKIRKHVVIIDILNL